MRSPCSRGHADMFGVEEPDVFLLGGPEGEMLRVVVERARTSFEKKTGIPADQPASTQRPYIDTLILR